MNQSPPPIYENIGVEYNRHRAAEPSVVRELLRLLGLDRGATIADIGSGTGNYSNALSEFGYKVKAVEPSRVMREQAAPDSNVEWHAGTAESIPLPDDSVSGVVCTLAMQHFECIQTAALEMQRVCPCGPIVIFTIDPRLGEQFWFSEYFPAIYKRLFSAFPPLATVCRQFSSGPSCKVDICTYHLPQSTVDMTLHAGWNRPEIYLSKSYRQNMSGFALAAAREVETGLEALNADLVSGDWDRRYGYLRTQLSVDLGFRFVRFVRDAASLRRYAPRDNGNSK